MPSNGNPAPQPPVPQRPQRPQQQPSSRLHPEAESLAFGYSGLLVELDQARAKIGELQRQLEDERRYRIYWQGFVRQVGEAAMRMLQGGDDGH